MVNRGQVVVFGVVKMVRRMSSNFARVDEGVKSKSKSKSKSNSNGNGNGKSNSKSKSKRREASLRQSGSAFGAAFIGRAEALPFRSETIDSAEALPFGSRQLAGVEVLPFPG